MSAKQSARHRATGLSAGPATDAPPTAARTRTHAAARHRSGGLPPALGTALLGGVVLLGFGIIVVGVVR